MLKSFVILGLLVNKYKILIHLWKFHPTLLGDLFALRMALIWKGVPFSSPVLNFSEKQIQNNLMLKNKLVLTSLGIFFSAMLPAQIRYGYQFSPTVSWLSSSSPVINTEGVVLGIKSGIVLDIPIPARHKIWFVSTGFLAHLNGGGILSNQLPGKYWINSNLKITADTFPKNTKLKYKLTYIEIPVGIKIGNPNWFYFESHANIGFRRLAKGEIKGTSNLNQRKILIKKEVNYFNFSLGAGFAYNIGRHFLANKRFGPLVGLFYEMGIADITKNEGSYHYPPSRAKIFEDSRTVTNSVVLRLGFNFN